MNRAVVAQRRGEWGGPIDVDRLGPARNLA
jgi:hypothetical protein